MPRIVRVQAADDTHLSFLRMMFSTIATERKGTDLNVYELVATAEDGVEFIEGYKAAVTKEELPDLITLDIEMPNADGLWALHELAARHRPHPPVVMISSLNEKEVKVKYAESLSQFDQARGAMPDEKKRELIARVAERIRAGQVEPGKANTLMDAGLRLGFDPIGLARFLGARGYIIKPYKTPDQIISVLDPAIEAGNGSFFTSGA